MNEFLQALSLVALAEMGDKTQLLVLALAARYRLRQVIAGVVIAALATMALAVAVGGMIQQVVPLRWIKLGAGLSFLGFAVWTLRGEEGEEGKRKAYAGAILTVAVSFFVAELGDKTQLATAVLAAESPRWAPVWLGATLGMLIGDGLGIAVGRFFGRKLPEKVIRGAAAVLFAVFGILLLLEGISG